jgi:hypothetical protein
MWHENDVNEFQELGQERSTETNLSKIPNSTIKTMFEKVYFDEDHLVVKVFEFGECVNWCVGRFVL